MRPIRRAPVESPSLAAAPGVQPYELKFLVDAALGERVERRALEFLETDPHGRAELGGAYQTTTLYLDTPELDVFHRRPSYRRRKFRIRRYGDAPWVCLERKSRSQDRVRKRRTELPLHELSILERGNADLDWPGYWFFRRIQAYRLEPSALLTYRRSAFCGRCAQGPLRLTIDRDIRGVLNNRWSAEPFAGGARLLTGSVILELKFFDAMPTVFKRLVEEMNLCATAISKYRLCREAHGDVPEVPRA